MKKQSKKILSKETAIALKAELSKYSDTFNVSETHELVQEVVESVAENVLKDLKPYLPVNIKKSWTSKKKII